MIDCRFLSMTAVFAYSVLFSNLSFGNDVKNVENFGIVKQKLSEYQDAYNDLSVSHRELFYQFYSIGLTEEFKHVNLGERFPSYILVRLMRLPAEVLNPKEVIAISCGSEYELKIFLCINIKGKNAANVDRSISIRYRAERGGWYIDSLAFKNIKNK